MQRTVLKYELPASHTFDPTTSFYTKPPRKFVGYVQFANSRRGTQPPSSIPALYKRQPRTSLQSAGDLTAGPATAAQQSRVARQGEQQSASACGRFRQAPGRQRVDAAKLLQDEFIRTHSNRLSKLPSFLSTHMSKFNASFADTVRPPHARRRSEAARWGICRCTTPLSSPCTPSCTTEKWADTW